MQGGKAPGVERIVADPASLTDGERRAWVTANAPELLALLQELQSHLGELRYRIGPLLEEVQPPLPCKPWYHHCRGIACDLGKGAAIQRAGDALRAADWYFGRYVPAAWASPRKASACWRPRTF